MYWLLAPIAFFHSALGVDIPPPPPPVPAAVSTPAALSDPLDGHPRSETEGAPGPADLTPVVLALPDGHTVTVDADRAPGYLAPLASQADHGYQMCTELQQAKPWIDWGCVAPEGTAIS